MESASLGWVQPGDKYELSAETGMGKGKNRITRSTSPSQVTPSSLKATTLDDAYNYHTLVSPPEEAPAKKGKLTNVSKHPSEYPRRPELEVESKPALELFELDLYEHEAQLRRAELPYVNGKDLGLSKTDNTGSSRKARQVHNMTLRLLRLEWLIIEKAGTRIAYLQLETRELNAESSVLWG